MRLSALGRTGLAVSRLCFGALTVGPLQADLSPDEGGAVLAAAIEHGVNFCDTAQLYRTYAHIRRGMELSGKRELIVASKTYAYTRELAKTAVEEARRGLNRDYIDIFMLHEQESIHTLRGHAEALEYLYEMKQKGVVKAVGISTHHVAGVYGAMEKRLDVVHPLINAAGLGIADGTREEMETAVRKAHAQGIGIYGMKSMGGGNLFRRAEECLKYALDLDCLDSIAVGMQTADEVRANVRFFGTGVFTADEREKLASRTRRLIINRLCTACGSCVRVCGQSALSIGDDKAVCDRSRCVLCGYCSASCPAWAIRIV